MLKLLCISLLICCSYAYVSACSYHRCYYSQYGSYCSGCITCSSGYTVDLVPYYCCLNAYKEKCYLCSDATNRCQICISNYGLNSSSLCELCSNYLPNCVACQTVNGCTACSTGYAVNLTDSRLNCEKC